MVVRTFRKHEVENARSLLPACVSVSEGTSDELASYMHDW